MFIFRSGKSIVLPTMQCMWRQKVKADLTPQDDRTPKRSQSLGQTTAESCTVFDSDSLGWKVCEMLELHWRWKKTIQCFDGWSLGIISCFTSCNLFVGDCFDRAGIQRLFLIEQRVRDFLIEQRETVFERTESQRLFLIEQRVVSFVSLKNWLPSLIQHCMILKHSKLASFFF